MKKKKGSSFLNEKLIPFFNKVSSARHMVALRDGMTAAVPMIIIGSIFMIIGQFPWPWYLNLMSHTFNPHWTEVVQYITNASFSIMGLIAVAGISYSLAKSYKDIDAFSAMIVAIAAYILTIPMQKVGEAGQLTIPLGQLGSAGLFTAMLVGLFVTDLYVWMMHKNLVFKMPDSVPPAVSNSFAALFPGAISLFVVWLIRIGVEATPMKSIPNVITFFLQEPMSKITNTLGGAIIIELVVCILWFCGIHGANAIAGIIDPIMYAALAANYTAFKAHQAVPNIVTKTFFDNFVRIGGCGATLGFVILMAFFAKDKEMKAIGRLSIGPAIFNINEPVIFGVPIVLNYRIAIPFVVAPVANIITTYTAMKMGWVAKTIGIYPPWTTPALLSGFLATGHISGSVMQLFNIIMDTLIYYGFFKSMDRAKLKEEMEAEKP
ncbi:PTS cellobiose transporter subunit IIC [Lactobacillus sp. ESL0791]|uniref:PTS cellobiose transporter subunit IIC n=1 Tax=Lactobacillus sp. ESL0791 TaxID=2983234 RepID=UPI0023FA24E8|nr:PTS cellobiose transporter subunit IIC [Lactobacillus sp. ESL0791]MDF7638320.1 PTS cellobiose transporter subunit IIC [Lactobacillus sp. ESL0791]